MRNIFILIIASTFFFLTPHTAFAQAIGSPTPSPTPLEAPKTAQPGITIGTFYNAKKETNPTFVLWGTADALTTISITIFPDNVSGSVMTDNVGRWQWVTPKSLQNGTKQLTITVTNDKGGQTVKTDTFTVIGAFQFPTAAVLFMLAIGSVVGLYIWMQSSKPKPLNQKPPISQPLEPHTPVDLPPQDPPSPTQP